MTSKSKHSVRVAQTSADARLNAAFEEAREDEEDEGGGGVRRAGRSFDYSKSGRPSLEGQPALAAAAAAPPQAITAYLQRMQRGGLTQSFGCLLAVVGFRIVALSENAAEMLEVAAGLGTDLRMLFTPTSACDLEEAARAEDLGEVNPVVVQTAGGGAGGTGKRFYAALHRMDDMAGGLVLDLEPTEEGGGRGYGNKGGAERRAAEMAAGPIARIQGLPGGDIARLCQAVVEEVRHVTGYDRVMAYRFHEDEHGEVVAEARRAELEPYLGLHYPATDVPQASRLMFMRNRVRMIGDAASPMVKVVQAKELGRAMSLAGSALRAPHGCHTQYMRNFGSAASLTMAVLIDDPEDDSLSGSRKLWGLVVCHHGRPRTVPYPVRAAMERLAGALGEQLDVELDLAAQAREKHILSTQTLLCEMLRRIRGAPIGIVSRSPSIMDLVKCDGAALLYGGRLWALGTAPASEEQVQDLADWVMDWAADEMASGAGVACTDSLAEAGYPRAEELGDAVCGVAAARITPNADFLFWFRSHTAKEVKWGGAEHDPLDRDDDTRMHPRSSFKAFLEVVRRRSVPWEEVEMDAVRSLQLILREELEKFCAAAASASERASVDVAEAPPGPSHHHLKKLSLKEQEQRQTDIHNSDAVGHAMKTKTTTGKKLETRYSSGAGAGGAGGGGGGWDKFSLPASLAHEWMEAIRGEAGGGHNAAGAGGGAPFNWDVLACFQQTSFVVVDATKAELPIVFASSGFFDLTGYGAREVIGGNCRFLQGPHTDPADVAAIRAALERGGGSYCGRLLNYRKDGSCFWNLLTIAPIKDEAGATVRLVGVQMEVSKYTEGARANSLRPNGLPQSLIKYDVRHQDKVSAFMAELVAALTRPWDRAAPAVQASMRLSLTGQTVAPLSPAATRDRERERRAYSTSDVPVPQRATAVEAGPGRRRHRSTTFLSLLGMEKREAVEEFPFPEPELIMVEEEAGGGGRPDSSSPGDDPERARRGIDLATTLERIGQSFVITDPRLPDNPIIFASDQFLELTEYSREEVLGRNCRFLQGRDTDPAAVDAIRAAVKERRDVTVTLLNYGKAGRPFWNLFHLQAMRDHKGELQYFIGVQQETAAPAQSQAPAPAAPARAERSEREVRATAQDVDVAARELPDANLTPDHLWVRHSKVVTPRPHSRVNSPYWHAVRRVQRRLRRGERLGLKHFRPIKPLGSGDTGSVHLVELRGTGQVYAMKAMDKAMMLHRNKVHRARAERDILAMMDHPFLPTLYASFQTKTHVCLITDFCPGGDLFLLLDRQPGKVLPEDAAVFYAAEVVTALEYLHCQGVIYRDLKPENVLLQANGHILLTDFDLSFLTSCRPQLFDGANGGGRRRKRRRLHRPVFCAEPRVASNSFVGTEEYIAPEIISGEPHSSAVDWWAFGILLYEMLYGRTPFRGRNRQKTFVNVLSKELTFPAGVPVSLAGRQLIGGLLHRDPASRLGAFRGASDIKRHPFFRAVNWPLIRWTNPPLLRHGLARDVDAHHDRAQDSDSDREEQRPLAMHMAASPPPFRGNSSPPAFRPTFNDVF
uniref:non-specific serine/threonine protein kinase n=1 Tax=Paraphymatoceros hallii TaxID=1263704 RepID=A0A059UG66_9EMBR|nr:neochrome [Paraphymatoceros hallii]